MRKYFGLISKNLILAIIRCWAWFSTRRLKKIEGIKKILVIKFGYMGDLILTTPALKSLRKRYPQAEITLLSYKPFVTELLESSGYVNNSIFLDVYNIGGLKGLFGLKFLRKFGNILLRLRREHFDILINLNFIQGYDRLFIEGILMLGSGAGYRIGLAKEEWAFLYHDRVIVGLNEPKHNKDRLVEVVHLAGAEETDSQTELKIGSEEKEFARNLLSAHNVSINDFLVCIHPCGSRPAQHWPWKRFALLANELIIKYNSKILFLGNAQEMKTAGQIEKTIRSPIINLVGKTPTIKHLAALIGESNMFIGNDSGPLHIAVALKVPSIGLFGPGRDHLIYGNLPRYIYVRKDDIDSWPCWPCQDYYCRDNRCMKAISVDNVLQSVQQMSERIKNGY